jgi:hypothetical protein
MPRLGPQRRVGAPRLEDEMFDPSDHIPQPVHGMDGGDYIYCSCGWDNERANPGDWVDHLPKPPDALYVERLRAMLEHELSNPWTGIRSSAARALFDKAKASRTREVTIAAEQLVVLLPAIESQAVFLAFHALIAKLRKD